MAVSSTLGTSWSSACGMQKADRFETAAAESSLRFQAGWFLLEAFGALLFQCLRWLEVLPLDGAWLFPPLCFAAGARALCLVLSFRAFRRFVHPLAMLCLLVDVALLTSCHPQVSHSVWWGVPLLDRPPPAPPSIANVSRAMKSFDESTIDRMDRLEHTLRSMRPGAPPPKRADQAQMEAAADEARRGRNRDRNLFQNVKQAGKKLEQANRAHKKAVNDWQSKQRALRDQYVNDYMLVVCGVLLQLFYTTVFVLPFRQAMFVLPFCFLLYCLPVIFVGEQLIPNRGEQFAARTTLEFCILAFGSLVNLAGKFRAEQSQRQVCSLLDEQQKQVINEKVLRCEAEFAQEQLIDDYCKGKLDGRDCATSATPSRAGAAPPAPKALTKARVAHAPPSLRSAPPASRGFLEAGLDCGTRSRGDCLPPSAAVWVEGLPLPMVVSKVSAGQRVLCYDTVGRSPRYVEVTDLQILTGKVQWVNVLLADGTELAVTANHPMQPQPLQEENDGVPHIGSPVMAKDLTPGSDCLVVMKLVPVPVANIHFCEEDSAQVDTNTRRVSLLLRQPERHEVFVAPPGALPQSSTVAVGSANVGIMPAGAQLPLGPVVKRTFIDVAPAEGLRTRRSSSLPPRPTPVELGPAADAAAGLEPPVPAAKEQAAASARRPTSASGRDAARGASRDAARDAAKKPWEKRMKRSNSDSTFSSSFRSSDHPEVEVLVSPYESKPTDAAALSDLLRARQLGLPSVGSAGHASGKCQVCVFHNRAQHEGKGPCWKGLLCDHCHAPHEPLARKKHKSGGMRRLLKKRAMESL